MPFDPPSPPANIEAEQSILGSLLMNNALHARISEFLEPVHFANQLHGKIFDTIGRLVNAGQLASVVSLRTYLDSDEAMKAAGPAMLADLATASMHAIDAVQLAKLVRDLALRRQIIALSSDAMQAAYTSDPDVDALAQIEGLERGLYDLASHGQSEGGFKTAANGIAGFADMAEAAYRRDGQITGLATGFRDLDAILGGLHKSDLIILAGRPAMGKSALATNIGFNVAKAHRIEDRNGEQIVADGGVVGFFSLEMSAEQLMGRIVAEHSGVPSGLIRQGKISNRQIERVLESCAALESLPMHVDDGAALSMGQIRARARRFKRQHGLGLIVIDYLQLIQAQQRRNDNRVVEVSEISRGLKTLAKELDVPVLALSQLSRAVEQREDKRPQLSDLRESGSIEQDADVVMFVYRDEYYAERERPERRESETDEHFSRRVTAWETRMAKAAGRAELIIAKHRHGPIGTVHLTFDAPFTRFGTIGEDS
ncbi:MAG: replicative DNA helicase [Proteobacteria bacterium]|nr:replicative DNA helicase [Pseudomonadota bacterium]